MQSGLTNMQKNIYSVCDRGAMLRSDLQWTDHCEVKTKFNFNRVGSLGEWVLCKIAAKAVTSSMTTKIADSGLSYHSLMDLLSTKSKTGTVGCNCFSEKILSMGKRESYINSNNVIDKVCIFLSTIITNT